MKTLLMSLIVLAPALSFAMSSGVECFNKVQPAQGSDTIVFSQVGLVHTVSGVITVYTQHTTADSTDPVGTNPADAKTYNLTLLSLDNGAVRGSLQFPGDVQIGDGQYEKDGTFTETNLKTGAATVIDVRCFLND